MLLPGQVGQSSNSSPQVYVLESPSWSPRPGFLRPPLQPSSGGGIYADTPGPQGTPTSTYRYVDARALYVAAPTSQHRPSSPSPFGRAQPFDYGFTFPQFSLGPETSITLPSINLGNTDSVSAALPGLASFHMPGELTDLDLTLAPLRPNSGLLWSATSPLNFFRSENVPSSGAEVSHSQAVHEWMNHADSDEVSSCPPTGCDPMSSSQKSLSQKSSGTAVPENAVLVSSELIESSALPKFPSRSRDLLSTLCEGIEFGSQSPTFQKIKGPLRRMRHAGRQSTTAESTIVLKTVSEPGPAGPLSQHDQAAGEASQTGEPQNRRSNISGPRIQRGRKPKREQKSTPRNINPDLPSYQLTANGKIDRRISGGCWTCKARRKKCDEIKPECGVCRNLGLKCDGYSSGRPAFLTDVHQNALHRQRLSEAIKRHQYGAGLTGGRGNSERRSAEETKEVKPQLRPYDAPNALS